MGKRKRVKVVMPDPAWTPFVQAAFTADDTALLVAIDEMPDAVYLNSIYQVNVRYLKPGQRGYPREKGAEHLTHLSIKRRDKKPIRDWRHMQRIKNEVLGPDVEACELFPAEARLVDTSNQYHLWALPEGKAFPWGFTERAVVDANGAGIDGSVQRRYENPPPDAMTKDEVERWSAKKIEELKAKNKARG
jgi:hypothetical protein